MSKVVIVAPDFQISWGHVGKSLTVFSDFLLRIGNSVEIMTPANAPDVDSLSEKVRVLRVLPNTYESVLTPNSHLNYPGRLLIAALTLMTPRKLRIFIRAGFQRIAWFLIYLRKIKNKKLWQTQISELTATDTIFFPSADFITLSIFLNFWNALDKDVRPRTVVRFINVFENMDVPHFYSRKRLFATIAKYQANSPSKLIVAAETDNYRKYLREFGIDVVLMYYPTSSLAPNFTTTNGDAAKITLVTLGSARLDKGFEKLAEIIPQCQSSKSRQDLSFVVQGPVKHWGYSSQRAERILKGTRDVEILPGKLADLEIQSALSRASMQLLPYYRDVYELRGSAMLFDGCDVGVPVIAPAGTGFAYEVNKYKLGITFSDFDQIPELINNLSVAEIEVYRKNIETFNQIRNQTMQKIFG